MMQLLGYFEQVGNNNDHGNLEIFPAASGDFKRSHTIA